MSQCSYGCCMPQQISKLLSHEPALESKLGRRMVLTCTGRPAAPGGALCLATEHQPTHEGPVCTAIQIGPTCLPRMQNLLSHSQMLG